jgi:hypothetical protein
MCEKKIVSIIITLCNHRYSYRSSGSVFSLSLSCWNNMTNQLFAKRDFLTPPPPRGNIQELSVASPSISYEFLTHKCVLYCNWKSLCGLINKNMYVENASFGITNNLHFSSSLFSFLLYLQLSVRKSSESSPTFDLMWRYWGCHWDLEYRVPPVIISVMFIYSSISHKFVQKTI